VCLGTHASVDRNTPKGDRGAMQLVSLDTLRKVQLLSWNAFLANLMGNLLAGRGASTIWGV
jgi:hypothetical protein